jgi:hypothetical protein
MEERYVGQGRGLNSTRVYHALAWTASELSKRSS